MMQANALEVPGLANAMFEKHEHGMARVDDIRGQSGIGCKETGEKAPSPSPRTRAWRAPVRWGSCAVRQRASKGPKLRYSSHRYGRAMDEIDGWTGSGNFTSTLTGKYSECPSLRNAHRRNLRSPDKGEEGERGQQRGIGGDAQMQGGEAGAARIESKEESTAEPPPQGRPANQPGRRRKPRRGQRN